MTHHSVQDFNCGMGSTNSLVNIPAPIAFVQALQHQVNEQDVHALIQSQKHMLMRFEKTNEMLLNCNALSAVRYGLASKELKKHIQLLVEMKKDLDSIFRRIRFLKMKVSQQYPSAFSACNSVFNVLDEEEEQEDKDTKKLQAPAINATAASSSCSQESSPSLATSPSTSDT